MIICLAVTHDVNFKAPTTIFAVYAALGPANRA